MKRSLAILGLAGLALGSAAAPIGAQAHGWVTTPPIPTYADPHDGRERTYALLPACATIASFDPQTRWLVLDYDQECIDALGE